MTSKLVSSESAKQAGCGQMCKTLYWLSLRISSLSTKELEVRAIYALNLLCNKEASNPEFKSYDGAQAIVEWSAPSGCSFRSVAPAEGGNDKPEREVEAVGSGIG
ncbi:hypothetical protein EDB86DRAFT_2930963 [Lactarius hatsudake]|nr:hypothetical protein EDB86DRAFT_2930963 [Lactarius hatsudake]